MGRTHPGLWVKAMSMEPMSFTFAHTRVLQKSLFSDGAVGGFSGVLAVLCADLLLIEATSGWQE